MPRDGSGIYSTPPGTHGTPNTTILSANYNSNVDDVATDLNTPRPIVAGGTGATTAAGALTALGAAPIPIAGQVTATATNDNAATGNVGEYISAVETSPGFGIASGVAANILAITLTAGDWDVSCEAYFLPAATTSMDHTIVSISTTSAAPDFSPGNFSQIYYTPAVVNGGNVVNNNVPTRRMSLAVSTTVFAVVVCAFTASTMTSYGIISARRAR